MDRIEWSMGKQLVLLYLLVLCLYPLICTGNCSSSHICPACLTFCASCQTLCCSPPFCYSRMPVLVVISCAALTHTVLWSTPPPSIVHHYPDLYSPDYEHICYIWYCPIDVVWAQPMHNSVSPQPSSTQIFISSTFMLHSFIFVAVLAVSAVSSYAVLAMNIIRMILLISMLLLVSIVLLILWLCWVIDVDLHWQSTSFSQLPTLSPYHKGKPKYQYA